MIELVYPYDGVPLIPPKTAADVLIEEVEEPEINEEFFPVIDFSGLVIGMSSRSYCHSGAKPLHPVVHLHIIDRYGHIYLQKRSLSKDIQPGKWDTAVGGHVTFGESIHETLYREAMEELDLTDFNPVHIKTYQYESDLEKEFVTVFATIGFFDLHPNMDELQKGRWWKFEDVDAHIGKSIFTPMFEEEYSQIKDSLLALL